jgi:hypothetical protein
MALLFAAGLLLGWIAAELTSPRHAQAQIPDPALQRQGWQQQAMETNRLLKEMLHVLRDETLKVQVVEPKKRGRTPTPKVETRR